MRNSFQNLNMFQCVSTNATASKTGHVSMYPLYICKISWMFETGNIAFALECMKINFRVEKYVKFQSL